MTYRMKLIVPALATILLFALAACEEQSTETGEIPQQQQDQPATTQ